ncbi:MULTISPECIES: hypothetical protein [Bradyrhizobium]|jgi:hypothetical protein|uniref:Uncharacterized protein n=1 Tax=Bradyrhizobium arachidis TaxID=858423 RepID=A0AAE7NPD2_9BRAD|nr:MULTISPECIES: hypothetical protein [Bradyrhizobium]QOG21229.1 hypothetical protein FOM02_31860 [Bradyrhizobium sp. SEMIA]QOZ67053.1 hypothetical protein WN72_12560 [Bradyrhizobium arachidis]UFW51765.1 hypothetical protein BaraCB756_12630 [Bradyrhizobium arachidis]SFV16982.1 hypothetical protein SAMN05192541_1275 [Bradyrhizobium arachidis]
MEFLSGWFSEYLIGESDDWMPRTWLGWIRVGLLAGLIGQLIYLIHACIALSVPMMLWFGLPANVLALVVVRRVLRWRYPV